MHVLRIMKVSIPMMNDTSNQIETLYEKDRKQEQIVIGCLDKNLYSKIHNNYTIIANRDLQIRGADIILHNSNGNIVHDAKAQASPKYINHPTHTFCQELLFDRDDKTHEGWFVRLDSLTDDLVFCWIHKARQNAEGYFDVPEDIKVMEVSFVNKKLLQDYVYNIISREQLMHIAWEMRKNDEWRRKLDGVKDMHFVQTPPSELKERPVNLIVHKRILDKLASNKYLVTQHGLTTLK